MLEALPFSTTSPTTRAGDCGLPIWPASPDTASTSGNSTGPSMLGNFSTRITSPGATRYCLPPARITAYMRLPPSISVVKVSPHHRNDQTSRAHQRAWAALTFSCLLCFHQGARAATAGVPRTDRQVQANSTILACGADDGQIKRALYE